MIKYLPLGILLCNLELLLAIEVPKINDIVPEILIHYPGYGIIIHFDNTTAKELDAFLVNSYRHLSVTFLVNYDALQKFRRPNGYKFVNVVYLTDTFAFEEYADGRSNLRHNDVVVFITNGFSNQTRPGTNSTVSYMWHQRGLERCGSVILYDLSTNDFHYCYFYVGNMSGILKRMTTANNKSLTNYINQFRNFNGHKFVVAYNHFPPFFECSPNKNFDCPVEGIDGIILLLLSRYLNFQFTLKPTDLSIQSKYRAILLDVHYRRRDWAVGGVRISLERTKLVDFTTILHMESFLALFSEAGQNGSKWNRIVLPFQKVVWICLISFVLIMALTLKAVAMAFARQKSTRFLDYLQILFRVVVQQSIPSLRSRPARIKLVISTWFLSAIIISTAYCSKLASSMILLEDRSPNSILELYDQYYFFQVSPVDWTVLKEALAGASDVRYRNVIKRCDNNLQFCPAIAHTIGRKVAFLETETTLQYLASVQCKNSYSASEMANFRMVQLNMRYIHHSWALQLGAPYLFRFSEIFRRLKEAGLVEQWYKQFIPHPITGSRSNDQNFRTASSLTISTFLGPAVLLVIGHAVATVVLLYEIIYFKFFAISNNLKIL